MHMLTINMIEKEEKRMKNENNKRIAKHDTI